MRLRCRGQALFPRTGSFTDLTAFNSSASHLVGDRYTPVGATPRCAAGGRHCRGSRSPGTCPANAADCALFGSDPVFVEHWHSNTLGFEVATDPQARRDGCGEKN